MLYGGIGQRPPDHDDRQEDAHLDDVVLANPILFYTLLGVDGKRDKRAEGRRRVEPDAREVAELAKGELVEQLCRERAVIDEVQPRVMLHEGQTPRRVHNAHKRVLGEDLAELCGEYREGGTLLASADRCFCMTWG